MNPMQFANLALLLIVLAAEIATDLHGQDSSPPAPPSRPLGLTIERLDGMAQFPGGITALPPVSVPPDNPQTQAKIDLGGMLFFDKNLSGDHSTSCATCHDPAKAFSDDSPTAVGIHGSALARRAPSLLNSAYNTAQFWDGRSRTLEQQALVPVLGKNEMGMPTTASLVAILSKVPEYRRRFREAFNREINLADVTRAIAAFERTLVTPDSAFDRYAGGDKQALTEQQKRGLILFIGKAACSQCHNGPNFTDNKFHSLGIFPGDKTDADPGRFAITRNPADRHAFKTPSLRSASQQSHFMHNGSLHSLEQVIAFYDEGGGSGPKSKLLFQLHLTDAEELDLLAFLNALGAKVPEE